MPGTNDAKRELRRTMRAVRQQAAVDRARSRAIVDRLTTLPEIASARTVMLFAAAAGEPDLTRLGDALRGSDVTVVIPTAERSAPWPAAPDVVDVVVVPGVAFTPDGDRLGQGAGWYDRFLANVRPDCTTIGVCFDEQVIARVPVDPHDVPVRWVVTPTTVHGMPRAV